MLKPDDRASVKVLIECIELQRKKGEDYNSSKSTVKQADYYRKGLSTIFDILWAKTLRMKSLIEAQENDPSHKTNFESLEDSAKDLINYASFFCAYSRGEVDGQKRIDPTETKLFDAWCVEKNIRVYSVQAGVDLGAFLPLTEQEFYQNLLKYTTFASSAPIQRL